MSLKIYHYSTCDTCRRALKFLERQGIKFTSVPIRDQPPSEAELKRMLKFYEGDLRKLFNTSGRDYKGLNLKDQLLSMTEEKAIKLLASNGNLIKRPFALTDHHGRVGFKEDEWQEFL